MQGEIMVLTAAVKFGISVTVFIAFIMALYYLFVFIARKIAGKKDAALPKKFALYVIWVFAGAFICILLSGKYMLARYNLPGGISISMPEKPWRNVEMEAKLKEDLGGRLISISSHRMQKGGLIVGMTAGEFSAPYDPEAGVHGAVQMAFRAIGEQPPAVTVSDIVISGLTCKTTHAPSATQEMDLRVVACGEGRHMWAVELVDYRAAKLEKEIKRIIKSIKINK